MSLDNRAVIMVIISIFLWSSVSIGETPKKEADQGVNVGLRGDDGTRILVQGSVILFWTAPGDDGDVGRATGYDMRYLPQGYGPINSDVLWDFATQATGEPIPSMSGQTDSMIIFNLTPGEPYYFCIKAYDDANNFSGLSNSPLVYASVDTNSGDFIPGDVNNDNLVNGNDVIFLVHYFEGDNDIPDPFLRGDANGSCAVNGLDVIYLVNYFRGAEPPFRGNCKQNF